MFTFVYSPLWEVIMFNPAFNILLFWLVKDCETNAKIGDTVIVESAIEKQTNLLVATSIVVE